MSRRYADLNDLIHDLDDRESCSDDPYGVGAFDDEDLILLGVGRPAPPPKPAPAKRGRPKKKPA